MEKGRQAHPPPLRELKLRDLCVVEILCLSCIEALVVDAELVHLAVHPAHPLIGSTLQNLLAPAVDKNLGERMEGDGTCRGIIGEDGDIILRSNVNAVHEGVELGSILVIRPDDVSPAVGRISHSPVVCFISLSVGSLPYVIGLALPVELVGDEVVIAAVSDDRKVVPEVLAVQEGDVARNRSLGTRDGRLIDPH